MKIVFVKKEPFVPSTERMRQYYEKHWAEHPEEWHEVLAILVDGVREAKGLPTGPGTWRIVKREEK